MAEVGFRKKLTGKGRLKRRRKGALNAGRRATVTRGTKRHTQGRHPRETKRRKRDAIPARPGESPVLFDPSTTPTNLPTRIFGFLYYSLRFRAVAMKYASH